MRRAIVAFLVLIGCVDQKAAQEQADRRAAEATAHYAERHPPEVQLTPAQKAKGLRELLAATMGAKIREKWPDSYVRATGPDSDVFEVAFTAAACNRDSLRILAEAAGQENMRSLGFRKLACRRGDKLLTIDP